MSSYSIKNGLNTTEFKSTWEEFKAGYFFLGQQGEYALTITEDKGIIKVFLCKLVAPLTVGSAEILSEKHFQKFPTLKELEAIFYNTLYSDYANELTIQEMINEHDLEEEEATFITLMMIDHNNLSDMYIDEAIEGYLDVYNDIPVLEMMDLEFSS